MLGQPVALVLLWTAMGAVFLALPLYHLDVAAQLLPRGTRLLQGRLVSASNIVLGISVVIFLVLGIQTIVGLVNRVAHEHSRRWKRWANVAPSLG